MPMIPKFNRGQVRKAMDQALLNLHQDIIRRLAYIGEQCVTESKKNLNIDESAFPKGDYTDQSANLRNSIAYVIVAAGKIVMKYNGPQTRHEAFALMDRLASKYNTGYALIIVAGMDYAVSVQSKGYNVISSSEKLAAKEVEKMLTKLKIK